jgi:hypothetical protein
MKPIAIITTAFILLSVAVGYAEETSVSATYYNSLATEAHKECIKGCYEPSEEDKKLSSVQLAEARAFCQAACGCLKNNFSKVVTFAEFDAALAKDVASGKEDASDALVKLVDKRMDTVMEQCVDETNSSWPTH